MKRQTLVRAAIVLTVLAALLSCQNPFDVGLGDNVDIEPPQVRLLSPDSGVFLRDVVTFEGFASDDTGIDRIEIRLNRGEWVRIPQSMLQVSSSGNRVRADWAYPVDTTQFSSARLRVQLRATDTAGRQTESDELTFTLDNDAPAILFTFPSVDPSIAPDGESPDYWFVVDTENPPVLGSVGKGGRIYGTTFDREAVEAGFPRYQLWRTNESQPSTWTIVESRSQEEPPSDLVDFSIPVSSDLGGDYLLRVQSQDVGGQQRTLGPYIVRVVEGAPLVSIQSPVQNGFVSGQTVLVEGTTSHEGDVRPTVSLRLVPGSSAPTVSVPSGEITISEESDGNGVYEWSYEFDSTAFADGTVTIEARSQIDGGDVVVPGFASVGVTVDNQSPTVNVSNPASDAVLNRTVTVTGTATDNYIVNRVEWRIVSDADPDPAWSPVDSGVTSWSFSFDSEDLSGEQDEPEPITVELRAFDAAGNESDTVQRSYTVDQRSDLPRIVFTNIIPDATDFTSNVITPGTQIRMNLEDDDGVQMDMLQYRYRVRTNDSPETFADWSGWIIIDEDDGRTNTFISDYQFLLRTTDSEPISDGLYEVEFWVEDVFGTGPEFGDKNDEALRTRIAVNSGPPLISLSEGISNSYRNGPFAVTGAVVDSAVGLTQVRLMQGSTEVGAVNPDGALSYDFSFDVDPDALSWSEGSYNLTVIADSGSGLNAQTSFSVTYDTMPPQITNFSVSPIVTLPGETGDFVNGVLGVAVSAADTQGLRQSDPVKWWFLPEGEGVDSWDYPGGTSFGDAPFSASVDTRPYDDEADMRLWVVARDRAGNDRIDSRALRLSQASDEPIVTFTQPTAGQIYQDRNNMSATGTVQDVDGLQRIEWRREGELEWTILQEWSSNWPTSFSWSINLEDLPDGSNQQIEVRATDRKAETDFSTATVSSPPFNVSTGSPEVEIVTPATGSFVNGSVPVEISGEASIEDPGEQIELVEYRWGNSGDWESIASGDLGNPAIWNASVEIPDGQPDGVLRLNIRAVASNGNSSTATREIVVETVPPTVMINAPASDAVVNGIISVSGSANDNVSVARVAVEVFDLTDDPSAESFVVNTENAGQFSWSFDISTVDVLTDGHEYLIRATAFDAAGNTAVAERSFTVDQSTDTPHLTFNNLLTDGQSILSGDESIAGTVTDDDGIEWIEYRFNGSGPWTRINGNLQTTQNFAIPVSGLEEGANSIELQVRDTAGFDAGLLETDPVDFLVDINLPEIQITSPAANSSHSSTFEVTGTAESAVGIDRVDFRIDSGGWVAVDSFDEGTGVWSTDVETDLISDGEIQFRVRAVNNNNRSQTENRTFVVDTTPPSLVITSPGNFETVNRTVLLRGTSSDQLSSVASVRAEIVPEDGSEPFLIGESTGAGVSPWEIEFDTPQVSESGGNWFGSATETEPGSGIWEVVVRITATDSGGSARTEDLTIFVDQTTNRPEITFSNFEPDTLFQSSGSIIGSVTDDDGVDYIEYRFRTDVNVDPAGDWSEWVFLDRTGAPTTTTFDIPYTGLPDGYHELQVRARDVLADHPDFGPLESFSETEAVPFRIDRLAPSLTVSSPVNNSFYNADVSVAGTVTDAGGLEYVRARIGSGDWTYFFEVEDNQIVTSLDMDAFSIPVDALGEGLYQVTVEARDLAGRTTSVDRTVTYDTTPPSVSVLTPDNGVNVNGRVTLRGTSSDDSGILRTEYRVGNSPTAEWVEFQNRFNWERVFLNINEFGNDVDAVETAPGSNIWQLPIYMRATDPAGNETVIGGIGGGASDYFLTVDPAGDNPEAIILQPTNGETVGGRIRVSGAAEDDDAVFEVQIAFDMNNDGSFSHPDDRWPEPEDGWPVGEGPVETSVFADADTTQWYRVNDNTTSGTWANWSIDLNRYGEFNPESGELRTIRIKVRAIDTKDGSTPGVAGNPEIITITIDPNVPSI